jgi:trypsin
LDGRVSGEVGDTFLRRISNIFFLLTLLSLAIVPASAITYGTEVKDAATSYPSVVSIWQSQVSGYRGEFICTGSLISPRLVLTAAHCIPQNKDGYLSVGYGANRLDETRKFADVSASWNHPRFSLNLLVNDVGLLLIDVPIDEVPTAPLVSKPEIISAISKSKGKYEVVGWGLDQNRREATYLKKVLVDDQTKVVKSLKRWNNTVWLAAGRYNSKERIYAGTCSGDSGGPLFALVGSRKVLVGITSWGAKNCELAVPSVFTRLSYYLSDIRLGMTEIYENEKTDNRLPPPIIVKKSSIDGPFESDKLSSTNRYTCNPAQGSKNERTLVTWFWGYTGKKIAEGPVLNISTNELVKNKELIGNRVTLKCNSTLIGPGGLTTFDSADLEISLWKPPKAYITVTKNHEADFAYNKPSTCKVTGDYPGQQMKWIASKDVTLSGEFIGATYPSDSIVLATGSTFFYTVNNISFLSGKFLYCVIERTNALGTTISAESSSYTWPAQVEFLLRNPALLSKA